MANRRLPKVIVFDLDYTLWPFFVECQVNPPFHVKRSKEVYDSSNRRIYPYPEIDQVLDRIIATIPDVKLGIASRSPDLEGATELLRKFQWFNKFSYVHIYPGSKDKHFRKIRAESGVNFEHMLFFDDDQINVPPVSKLGVTFVLLPDGMSLKELDRGLKMFAAAE